MEQPSVICGLLTAAGGAASIISAVGAATLASHDDSDTTITSSRPTQAVTATTTIKRSLPAHRSDFLLRPDLTYLNCATLGPTPRCVIRAVVAEWEALAADPLNGYFGGGSNSCKRMETVRAAVANFLGANTNEIVLVPSTTVAYNTIAEGLVTSGFLSFGDTVLSSDHEHPGGEMCWMHLAEATVHKIHYERVTLPDSGRCPSSQQIVAAYAGAISNATTPVRVIAVSHVLTTTGLVLPIAELAELAHRNGAILVVDGAQSAGGMEVDLSKLGCDAYTVSAHKWGLAPTGSGVLYLNAGMQPKLKAAFLHSGFSAYSASSGTRPVETISGLGHALDYLQSFGMAAITAHNRALRELCYSGLVQLESQLGIEVVSPPQGEMSCSIVSFAMPADGPTSGELVAELLKTDAIVIKQGTYQCHNGSVRLSFHLYNTERDVHKLLQALPQAFVRLKADTSTGLSGGGKL